MSNVSLHMTDRALPTVFESLAAVDKFIAVPRLAADFYAKHRHAVDFTSAFLRQVASSYPPFDSAFRAALPLPIREGAVQIEATFRSGALPPEKMEWFDAQMTEVLKVLVPIVRDPELPDWLQECKWAIEGAFE